MPKNPEINNGSFFDLLDNRPGMSMHSPKGPWPWSGIPEDRAGAEEQVTAMYESWGYARPKFAWCLSPRSMNGAMTMLRQVHKESRFAMVNALVPSAGDPVEVETKRTLLHAMLDVNLTVTVGASLRDKFRGNRSIMPLPMRELSEACQQGFTPPLTGMNRPANWSDVAVWPMEYVPFEWLPSQALVISPYLKLCWLSRPPVEVQTEGGHLTHARFADGWEVQRLADDEDERLELEVSKDIHTLGLPAPEEE